MTLSRIVKHRAVPLTVGGACAVYAVAAVGALIDGSTGKMHHWSFIVFIVLTAIVSLSATQRLLSGRWSIRKWTRFTVFGNNLILAMASGFACASAPQYWAASAIVYFSAQLLFLGLFGYAATFLGGVAHCSAYLITLYLLDVSQFDSLIGTNFAVVCGIGTYLFFIGLTSGFSATREARLRRFLRASRRDKRTIAEERQKSDRLLFEYSASGNC